MYPREVAVTRLRKGALLGNGRPQQYPDGVYYGVGPQAINRVPCSQLRALLRIERGLFDGDYSRGLLRTERIIEDTEHD
jgi:hypothetical protein